MTSPFPPSLIQHIRDSQYSILVLDHDGEFVEVQWEFTEKSYSVQTEEIEYLLKALRNASHNMPIFLLISAFDEMHVSKEVLELLHAPDTFKHIEAVAIHVQSTTQKFSVNLYRKLQGFPKPVRAFTEPTLAIRWLQNGVKRKTSSSN